MDTAALKFKGSSGKWNQDIFRIPQDNYKHCYSSLEQTHSPESSGISLSTPQT